MYSRARGVNLDLDNLLPNVCFHVAIYNMVTYGKDSIQREIVSNFKGIAMASL